MAAPKFDRFVAASELAEMKNGMRPHREGLSLIGGWRALQSSRASNERTNGAASSGALGYCNCTAI